jgi:putative N-acetylmannosamine-6-phosphate epimerase
MKKLSWMAAAAALLVTAWTVTVPPSDNSASETLENPLSPTRQHRPPSLVLVNNLDTNHDGMAAARAPHNGVGTTSVSFTSYRRCRQHMDQNFSRLKRLRQIALECHANAGYLRRVFQRYAHQTPDQYLLPLKMNHAAELQRQTT